jgi:hypothetical protein
MKANELRIGNLVQYKKGHLSIIDGIQDNTTISVLGVIDDYINGCYDVSNFNGTPLTEEWLIKFGFKPDFQGNYEEAYVISKFYEGFYFVDDRLGNFNVKPIHYIHEFQNLYFALTGVELELSSNVA